MWLRLSRPAFATGIHITVTDTSGLAQVIAIAAKGDLSWPPRWQRPWEDLPEPTLRLGSPKARRTGRTPPLVGVWGERRAGRWFELGRHSAGHQSYLNRPALRAGCLLCPPPATITPLCSHLFQPVRGATWNVEHFPGPSLYWRLPRRFILACFCCDRIVNILPSFS